MAIIHAMRFLKEIDDKPGLREALYGVEGQEALFAFLKEAGYPFTGAEFEEAVDHVHVDCQTHEEADALMNKVNWFRMVSANA